MPLPLSTAQAARLEFLPECGSTNTELVIRAADAWPHFSVVATTSQTAGRGRLDRVWVAPPGQTLAVSVLLRPTFALESYGWLPLIAGLAMARAVESSLPGGTLRQAQGAETSLVGQPPLPELVEGRVAVKWPNDVQIDGLKVSGLLAELLP